MTDLEKFVNSLRCDGQYYTACGGKNGAIAGPRIKAAADMLRGVFEMDDDPIGYDAHDVFTFCDSLAAKAPGNSTQDDSTKQGVPPP